MRQASAERGAGAELASRLRSRREEIESAVLTRILALSEPPRAAGPEYTEGLRQAVSAAVEHAIEQIEVAPRIRPRPPRPCWPRPASPPARG